MSMKASPGEYRPTLWDGLVVAAVLALAVITALAVYTPRSASGTLQVVVSAGGEPLETMPLSAYAGTHTYSHNGYTLTVHSDGTQVQVLYSTCPGGDCVHMGAVSDAGQSIVCLPARLVIRLAGSGADVIVG